MLLGRLVAIAIIVAACGAVDMTGPVAAAGQGSPMTIIPEYSKQKGGPKPTNELFAILDSNGDGQIDRSEWQIRKMAIFYMRDRNNDTQLGRDEIPGLNATRFAEADLNGDGVLSGFEFNQASFSQFDKADANSDGVVTREEFRVYLETLNAPR